MSDPFLPDEGPAVKATSASLGDPDFPGLAQSIGLVVATIGAVGVATFLLGGISFALGWEPPAWFEMTVVNLLGIGLVLFWGSRRVGVPFSEIYRFKAFPVRLLLPLPVLVIGFSIVLSELDNLVRVVLPMPDAIFELFSELMGAGWGSLIVLVVVAPVTEELLFRGLILRGLIAQRGVWSGVFYSSLLFGIMHLNPWQFVSAFLAGLLLGWLFVLSRSLWPCIVLHALFNGLAFWVTTYAESYGLSIPGYTGEPSAIPTFQPPAFDLLGIALLVIGFAWISQIFASEHRRTWPGG